MAVYVFSFIPACREAEHEFLVYAHGWQEKRVVYPSGRRASDAATSTPPWFKAPGECEGQSLQRSPQIEDDLERKVGVVLRCDVYSDSPPVLLTHRFCRGTATDASCLGLSTDATISVLCGLAAQTYQTGTKTT